MTTILTDKHTEKPQIGNLQEISLVQVKEKGFMIKGQVVSAVDGRNIINTDLAIYDLYNEKVATARTDPTGRFAFRYDGSENQLKAKVLAPDCGVYGLEKSRKVFDVFTIQLENDRKEYTKEIFKNPFKVNVMEAAFAKIDNKDVLINTPARYIFR